VDAAKELGLVDLADRSLRERLRTLLGSKRGRTKFLAMLYHNPPFDRRYVTVLPYENSSRDAVWAELVARGAPHECYVISTDSETSGGSTYDGTTMRLRDALDECGAGTILLCVPGRLAYYEGEAVIGGGYQWIVERRT
jgi:hypothetical protein